MNIGLSGYASSGKNAVASVLTAKYGYTEIAWADSLRAVVLAINPILRTHYQGVARFRVSDALERYGYRETKDRFGEYRDLLQRTGTEAGRNIIGPNVWVDATLNMMEEGKKYVITDCRFPNEAVEGFFMVRVMRPGVGPVNDHPSETSLDDYNFNWIINNDGTLEDLDAEVRHMMKHIERNTDK